jgi:hypothetical protein
MKIIYTLIIFSFLILTVISACDKEKEHIVGFWTFGNDKEWVTGKGGNVDNAFSKFNQLKENYGDQFQLVIEDLKQYGISKTDGTETTKVNIKIIIDPPSSEIESQLKALGLIYVEQK